MTNLPLIAHDESHFCVHGGGSKIFSTGQAISVNDASVCADNLPAEVYSIWNLSSDNKTAKSCLSVAEQDRCVLMPCTEVVALLVTLCSHAEGCCAWLWTSVPATSIDTPAQ